MPGFDSSGNPAVIPGVDGVTNYCAWVVEFDIEIQYQDFRREGKTIKEAIDFMEKLAR